jgi:hypothetical protein
MAYPVSVRVERRLDGRDRLTTALRPLLAIPHSILVGPIYFSARTGGVGLLGAAAYVLAIVSWVTLLVTGRQQASIREFHRYYLRWRANAVAYMALFVDGYPPFGEGAYPVSIEIHDPVGTRDSLGIAIRILLGIPHVLVLAVLLVGWLVTTVIAWFAILFSGRYPASLYPFGAGVMQWALRVEAYMLLLVDEYPPFQLHERAASA